VIGCKCAHQAEDGAAEKKKSRNKGGVRRRSQRDEEREEIHLALSVMKKRNEKKESV
jgi:hypothetical protein